MYLRRFNTEGIERFRDFILRLQANNTLSVPTEMLLDDSLTEFIEPEVPTHDVTFANRLHFAQHIDRLLATVRLAHVVSDVGLWSWLSLRYFNQLCPADGTTRKPGELARWIPIFDQGRYYRHFVLGPYVIFNAHRHEPHHIEGLLADAPHVATGEIYRHFMENPSLLLSRSALAAATALYYDPNKKRIKPGAKAKDTPGACRRLIRVLQQFDCTFDLYMIDPHTLLNMLPREFDRFRTDNGHDAMNPNTV